MRKYVRLYVYWDLIRLGTLTATVSSAVGELGGRWEEVSLRVGRHAGDCRDRYRNHIAHRGARLDGMSVWLPGLAHI